MNQVYIPVADLVIFCVVAAVVGIIGGALIGLALPTSRRSQMRTADGPLIERQSRQLLRTVPMPAAAFVPPPAVSAQQLAAVKAEAFEAAMALDKGGKPCNPHPPGGQLHWLWWTYFQEARMDLAEIT